MKKVEIISVIKAGDMDKLSIDELIRARNIPELAEYREKIIALTQSKLEEEAQDKKAPNPQPQEEKQLTEEENKQLEENGQHLEELGQNVRLTEESEKAGKNLYAQREDGAEVNVYDEIKSIAKMQVEVNNVDKPEKMTQEEYNRAVETEIRTLIAGIFTVSDKEDGSKTQTEADEDLNKCRELNEGKKVSVNAKRVGNVLSAAMGDVTSKLEKFKQTEFGQRMGRRINSVDSRLSAKLGKAYTTPRDYVRKMVKSGNWVEVAAGLGVGAIALTSTAQTAAVAMGVYSAAIGIRRVGAFVKQYGKDKKLHREGGNDHYSFAQYCRDNKKEFIKASLYTAAAVAGVGAAAFSMAGNVAMQATARGARLGAAAGAALVPQGIDWGVAKKEKNAAKKKLLEAQQKGDEQAMAAAQAELDAATKELKAARKRTLIGGALFGTMAALGGHHGGADTDVLTDGGDILPDNPATGAGIGAGAGVIDNGDTPVWAQPADSLGIGVGDSIAIDNPADDLSAGTDIDADAGANSDDVVTDMPTENVVSVEPIGEREQLFYEKRMETFIKSEGLREEIKFNVENNVVPLPENMTVEQAVHLAAMDKLYYGDDTALKTLINCDTEMTAEDWANLHDKFVTQIGDPRGGMGYPTDPNYVADPNRIGRINDINCEEIKVSVQQNTPTPIKSPDLPDPQGLPKAPTAHPVDPDYKIPTDDNGNPLRTHYGTEEHGESVKDFHNAGGKVPTSSGAVTETQKVEVTAGENGEINTHGGSAWNNINVIRNSGRD